MDNQGDMSQQRFDREYAEKPAWDIGKAQHAMIERLSLCELASPVIEVGCGMGYLSVFLAEQGYDVLGIDFAEKAVNASKKLASSKSSNAKFETRDVFSLADYDKNFNTVIDCCFFHMFDDESRQQYQLLLQGILKPGGKLYMLNFAIDLPTPNAPRGISREDLESLFVKGWKIHSIEDATIEVTFAPSGIPGTYACIDRL